MAENDTTNDSANSSTSANDKGKHKTQTRRQRKNAASIELQAMQAARAEMELDDKYDLNHPRIEDWEAQSQEVIAHCYKQISSDFFGIVNDYLVQANTATLAFKDFSEKYTRSRRRLIIATGLLASINVCATFGFFEQKYVAWPPGLTYVQALNALAALWAGWLTVAGNMENFLNKAEKATAFRETRDLLLDCYREYCFKWAYFVETYGTTATACMNAGRLYRQLVDVDRGLRIKVKQLTETQPRDEKAGGR